MKKVQRKPIQSIIYLALFLIVIISNFFAENLERILMIKPDIYKSNSTQVHFIDVGQGDAIAIKLSNGKVMLIDSGISDYRKKYITYLDNIVLTDDKTIDYLVLTHPDIDHSANIEYLLDNYNVKNFYRPEIYEESENLDPYCSNSTYKGIINNLKDSDTEVFFNSEREIVSGNIKITWLSVLDLYDNKSVLDTNQFSPIIIVEDNGKKIMFTGDIDATSEGLFIEKYGDKLDVDILKLAHHGSKYSNSEEFLSITSPEYVVACVGENTYGHPANDTIQRLLDYDEDNNTELFNTFKSTKDDGNIVYTLESEIVLNEIGNIDNYNFSSYFVYSTILLIIMLLYYLNPYYNVWKKNIRFVKQNKKFENDLKDRKDKK